MDEFTRAYVECALWSSRDGDSDTPLDRDYGVEDIAPETLEQIKSECAAFQLAAGEVIDRDLSQAGVDFWLTRNGLGCGFWDGNWLFLTSYKRLRETLTLLAKSYQEYTLYVGDDGLIYGV